MTNPLALVIEDDEGLTIIFAHALQKAGYDTEVFLDGQEALDRLKEIVPHLVLLDMNLPHVPGTAILSHIRSDARLAETRVVVSTANPHIAVQVEEKADLVLVKPVGFKQLLALAERLRPR